MEIAINKKTSLAIKVVLMGSLIAVLVYLFHPASGQFSFIINGEPVTNPIIQFAAFPTLLAILVFTGILTALAFFGVGLFMFLGILLFMLFGIFMIAPFAWPVLVVILITIVVMSFGNNKSI